MEIPGNLNEHYSGYYEKLYSLTYKFPKVVQKQISGEVVEFIPSFSAVYL